MFIGDGNVKKAGDLLSFFFDEKRVETATHITKLFSSWDDITSEQGIPAAAAHARIAELNRNVILIEADHPGWIQILQTKQRWILDSFKRKFPSLNITGISFHLSRSAIETKSIPVQSKFLREETSEIPIKTTDETNTEITEDKFPFETNETFKNIIEMLANR